MGSYSKFVSIIMDLELIRDEIEKQIIDGLINNNPRIGNLIGDISDLSHDIGALYSVADNPTWPAGYYTRLLQIVETAKRLGVFPKELEGLRWFRQHLKA